MASSKELDSFISGLKSQPSTTTTTKQETPEKGQYYMDQNTGQYYFHSGDGEPMTIVPTEDEGPGSGSGSGAASNSIAANDNQVVLNTGGDQYQTVTIVPSDGNTGEVSYVLIVQQPEDKDKGGGHGGAGSDE